MRRSIPALFLAAVLAGVAAAGMAACGDDGAGSEASFKLKIADLVPLTGDLAAFGPPGRKAADLAVAEIRQAIAEVGANQSVSLRHADDRTDPRAGARAARALVADGAQCIAGPWATPVTRRVAESVAVPRGVLVISPASTGDALTSLRDDGLVNRTVPPDSFQGPALADAVEEALGGAQGKVISVAARDDSYGTGLAKTFGAAWPEKGGRIGAEVVYPSGKRRYASEAERIVAGDPDGWVIFDFPATYAKVGPALVRTGKWDPRRTFVTDGLASADLPEQAGSAATEGIRGTAPGSPEKLAAAKAFDRLYREAPGPERQTFDAQAFDAVVLCYLAAVAAGSAEGPGMAEQLRSVSAPGGDKYSWQQLPDAVRALQDGEDIDYEGASGPIDLDENGDTAAGVYDLFRYEDGRADVFGEVELPR